MKRSYKYHTTEPQLIASRCSPNWYTGDIVTGSVGYSTGTNQETLSIILDLESYQERIKMAWYCTLNHSKHNSIKVINGQSVCVQ